ncbi:MAG: hypothetical protein JO016_13255 [Actinobacteria bacterium]|nr:hypothetical protein [Actinomycetota bacterium]
MIVVTLVVFYPLAFSGLEGLMRAELKSSNISQAYAALSALASSLALIGVVISLFYQARAGRTAREQSIRNLQQQLITMEMEDPSLMTAVGAPWGLPIPAESAKIREHLYIHMWASYWAGIYAVGEINTAVARKIARAELFGSEAGREYWTAVRNNVLSTNEGKYKRFVQIVDQEYRQIIAKNIPTNKPVKDTSYSVNAKNKPTCNLTSVAAIAGALVAGMLICRKLP